MSRREVRFSFDTENERDLYAAYAAAKGLTLSALAKMALFQYTQRFDLRPNQLAVAVKSYVTTLSDAAQARSCTGIGVSEGEASS